MSTQEQRDALLSQLAEVEDWLYGDGEAVQAAEYRSQLATLRGVGDRLFERVAEAEARPRAVQLASGFVELARKAANSWPDLKPWLNASDVAALAAKVVGHPPRPARPPLPAPACYAAPCPPTYVRRPAAPTAAARCARPAQVDNFSAWLTSKQAEQAARAPHDEPAFRAEEVTTWLARLQQARCGVLRWIGGAPWGAGPGRASALCAGRPSR